VIFTIFYVASGLIHLFLVFTVISLNLAFCVVAPESGFRRGASHNGEALFTIGDQQEGSLDFGF